MAIFTLANFKMEKNMEEVNSSKNNQTYGMMENGKTAKNKGTAQ